MSAPGVSRTSLAEVEFRVLGPIEVMIGDAVLPVPPGRPQIILGALLLDANRVVSTDHLIDVVWDERPPSTARSQVQICVSALRQTFKSMGLANLIETRPPGYLLRVGDGQLDIDRFGELTGAADEAERAGRPQEAVDLLRQALALWRGPVLGGDISQLLRGRAVRLEEERLRVLEHRIELELRLDRHHRLVGEVSGLVEEHPLRERLRGQLMLALYRSGRPAEALAVYRTGRELQVAELGLEPGDELKRLHAAILADDDTLRPDRTRTTTPEPKPAAGPHQLPADIADFAGRETLIDEAEHMLLNRQDQAVGILVIIGKAGIGKTTLAVHLAHRMRAEHFTDGQLYCNFAGMRGAPATPSDVLARFLRALGVPGSGIPDGIDERAELYRSLLNGKRVLVVLDDVTVESQVLPLLPGSETCAVIVTSRTRLAGIPGALLLEVDVMLPGQALRMLGGAIGFDRVDAEPSAAEALVRLVGGLPLALRIVAARLAARPHWSLAAMLGRLADERHRLDELAYGDLVVRASLSLTYDGLEPRAARLFRLLGSVAAESLPAWVAAALLDEDAARATEALELLVDTQMMDVVSLDLDGRPRFAFHDIIRVFAREQLMAHESAPARLDGLRRVLGGWLALLGKAHRKIYGGDFTVLRGNAPRLPPQDAGGVLLTDPLAWLEAERPNLCLAVGQAADAGLHELSWELAVGLVTLFEAHSYFDEWQQTHQHALEAVRAAGNRYGEAALLCSLGSLQLSRHRPAAARAVLVPALRLFGELGDEHGLAMTRRNLALLAHSEGRLDESLAEYHLALTGFRQVGDVIGQAHVFSQVARIELDAGHHDAAVDHLERALDICREVGGLRVEAQVLHGLGEAMYRQRRYDEAMLVMNAVLEMVRGNGDAIGESFALHTLGLVHGKLGSPAESERMLRAAIEVRERIMDSVGAAQVSLDLVALLRERGEFGSAADVAQRAFHVFADRLIPVWEGRARGMLDSLTEVQRPADTR